MTWGWLLVLLIPLAPMAGYKVNERRRQRRLEQAQLSVERERYYENVSRVYGREGKDFR